MLKQEFDTQAERIISHWKRYTNEHMDILWRMLGPTGMSAMSLAGAIDAMLLEYPPHRTPRLKSFVELARGRSASTQLPSLSTGAWIEVDARYSEKFENDRHWGRLEDPKYTAPTRPADEEPDECEKAMGPDVRAEQRQRAKFECPF